MFHRLTRYSSLLLIALCIGLLQIGGFSKPLTQSEISKKISQSPWYGKIPLVEKLDTLELVKKGYQRTVLAGGCFWCMQGPFDYLPGVKLTRAGYAGGFEENPKYKDVSYGRTSHTEAVEIWFNPKEISYSDIIETYWKTMDPTDLGGQFADRGSQYRPVIFYMNETQKLIAENSKKALERSKRFKDKIVVPIKEYKNFYTAAEYHQFYYLKNPPHYFRYREGSGRAPFLKSIWGPDAF